MKIAIGTATGNIGSRTARKLAATGIETILIGRNKQALSAMTLAGATIRIADVSNVDQVVQATDGAEALLWLVPPAIGVPSLKGWYEAVTQAGITAALFNGINRVVLITSLGVGMADNMGTITYVSEMEKAFNAAIPHVVALRPGYFMENFLSQRDDILHNGFFSFPYEVDHDLPFISTDDIGDVAAGYLADPTWAGQWSRNLMGPRNLTMTEATHVLSVVLERPVRYKQTDYSALPAQFATWGASATVQQELKDLYRALGDSQGVYATPRTLEVNTSTTFEQFATGKLLPPIRAKIIV